jgi:thiamine-monophosphate kinase
LAPLEHALNDGEDFELCVVVPPEQAGRLMAAPPEPARLFRVGEITAEPGLRIRDADGKVSPLEARGFDHFRSRSTSGGGRP